MINTPDIEPTELRVVTNSWLCEDPTGLRLMVREFTTVRFGRFRDTIFESVLKTELITDGGQPAMWAEPGPSGGMLYVMSSGLRCRHIVCTVFNSL